MHTKTEGSFSREPVVIKTEALTRKYGKISAVDNMNLEKRADDLVNTYSGGMRRRLELACGIMHHPKIYMQEKECVISSIVSPLLWIFAFGAGVGSTVETVQGYSYQIFISVPLTPFVIIKAFLMLLFSLIAMGIGVLSFRRM